MIPKILHRTVPVFTSGDAERWWAHACELHPEWEHRTWRDILDPGDFPLTAEHWWRTTSGAQFAGLVRLEVLWHHGGFYLDSDFEPYRPLDPLRGAALVAGWQDPKVIPDAVLGAERHHPAIRECIDLALERIERGEGAHRSGPDVVTEVFPRHAALLLPPGSFYPYHFSEKARRGEDHRAANPWAFGAHHWAGLDPGGWAT